MTVQAAHRVTQLVDELLKTRVGDLANIAQVQARVRELHGALTQVSGFADGVGNLLTNYEPARRGPGRPMPSSPAIVAPPSRSKALRPRGHRRGRARGGVGEFAATSFIVGVLQSAGAAGLRPRDIVERIAAAAPGHHAQPSALVSTTLRRLKDQGKVTKTRGGKWAPTAA